MTSYSKTHPFATVEPEGDSARNFLCRGEARNDSADSRRLVRDAPSGPQGLSRAGQWQILLIFWSYTRIYGDMPKAVVELSEHANRVVNVVKARDGLKGKSEAIESIVAAYEERILDPALRPEFAEDLRRIRRGKFRRIQSLDEVLGDSH